MNALVREGYRRAREVTRRHARSFHLASVLLLGSRRRAAFALYAFCRRLDDLVDGGAREGLDRRLAQARALVSGIHDGRRELALDRETAELFPPAELAALRDTVERFGIPEAPFQELISGMEMDLGCARYASFQELDRYCDLVAGTVGRMLCPVLGARGSEALRAASDLGRAMQLTNILRDVAEDLGRGRVYLPADELRAFGLSEKDLRRGVMDDRMRAFLRCQVARARALYGRGARGVRYLRAPGAQRVVRLMGALYGGILGAIEAMGYDVFRGRARVGRLTRAALVLRAVLFPQTLLPAPPEEPAVPLLPTVAGP
ncbi:MAG TPA: squalene/phytoene synthase family protein [Myxococcaceae bacterium]|nr:squalene/phytoene synthase family protein [Myxococcaceae bacterium]